MESIENGKEVAISVSHVAKRFKIYHDKPSTLKDRMLLIIKKAYAEFWALKDISFTIEKGSAVGLIGHNGCGKSTLLKLLTRIIYPDKGEIVMNGRVSSLLELGAGFHPDFTGRENIYTNAAIFGLSRHEIDRRLQSVIDFSELGEFIDNPVRTYSSGMYMRLAFSVAIHVSPEILLIDEILAVGDANFQKKCLDKIKDFKAKGITIVIVSHDLSTIERICDRAIWLEDGIIQRDGRPKEVVTAYLSSMAERQNVEIEHRVAAEAATAMDSDKAQQPQSEQDADAAQSASPEAAESATRWGSRELEIVAVSMRDKTGTEHHVFDVEDSADIVITYKQNKPVPDVCFGFGIFSSDGKQCYGTNTHIDNADIAVSALQKSGTMTVHLQRLGLIEGSYWLDIAIHDENGYPYDYQLRRYEFSTVSPNKDVGFSRLPHEWELA